MARVSIAETGVASARVLGRVDNWWFSKVAPALALSYCSALVFHVTAWPAARSFLMIAFVGLCAGSYGHIINDVFDIEVDRKAGKRNHMAAFSPWRRFGFCALTLGLGFAPALFIPCSSISLLLLAVEFLLPTIYSIPPIRLKGRGALGLVCDSLGAHLVPCLYVISVFASQVVDPSLLHRGSSTAFVWFAAVWALCVGLIGILIHEFEDRENDLQSGIRTFATDTQFATVKTSLTLLYVVELSAFAGLTTVLFPVAPVIGVAGIVFVFLIALKLAAHWQHYRHYERDATAIQWWQLSHSFYEAYLPLAAAIQCAWAFPVLTIFPVLQFTVFASTFKAQWAELIDVLRSALPLLAFRGRMDVESTADARVWPILVPLPGARVVVREPGSAAWMIRLVRPGVSVKAGTEYSVRFHIRAERERTIAFGVWQDHAPWDGAGYYEDLRVSPAQSVIERIFIAPVDEPEAYLGFWLGGEAGAVDVLWCSIRAVSRHSVG